jgi:DNA-binding NarL/FixJ family response regulator
VGRHTNAQIAAELCLSVKTIEAHMRNLFRTLDVLEGRGAAHGGSG